MSWDSRQIFQLKRQTGAISQTCFWHKNLFFFFLFSFFFPPSISPFPPSLTRTRILPPFCFRRILPLLFVFLWVSCHVFVPQIPETFCPKHLLSSKYSVFKIFYPKDLLSQRSWWQALECAAIVPPLCAVCISSQLLSVQLCISSHSSKLVSLHLI